MNSRRKFLKSLGIIGLGSMSNIQLSAKNNILNSQPTNESIPTLDSGIIEEKEFWNLIKDQFQIPTDYAYFNTGTVGISPLQVVNAITKNILSNEVYGYYNGEEEARDRLSKFVGIHKDTLCLTHSTTDGLNIAINSIPLERGDEVIISSHEHASHALPWIKLSQEIGIILKVFNPQATALQNINTIKNLINKKTKVIAIPHISCTIGTVYPIKAICNLARTNNIYTVIDGAHSTGMIDLYIEDLGCDFYASCCHKWLLGSKGTGYLYIRKDILDNIPPKFLGANSAIKWNLAPNELVFSGYQPNASRYEYGTKNAPLWHGIVAAINLFEKIGMKRVEKYVHSLSQYLFERLKAEPHKYEILSSEEEISRAAIIGFKPLHMDYKSYFMSAKKENIRIRSVDESNLSSIRISTHIYNNKEEIDRLLIL